MEFLDSVSDVVKGFIQKKGQLSFSRTFKWTGYMNSPYKHFQLDEVEGLQDEFVKKLDQAREIANTPFRITSGKRTFLENEQISGAVSDSAHLDGTACDLACSDSSERFKIIKALLEVGFCRIGVYEKHIHADISGRLPQNVMWFINAI